MKTIKLYKVSEIAVYSCDDVLRTFWCELPPADIPYHYKYIVVDEGEFYLPTSAVCGSRISTLNGCPVIEIETKKYELKRKK